MTGLRIISLLAICNGLLTSGCDQTEELENIAPTCTIILPGPKEEILKGTTIKIVAEADDMDGYIAEVRFYIDEVGLASSDSYPYSYEWNTVGFEKGSHTIEVMAKDNRGGSMSDEIIIILISNETGTVADYDGNIYNTVKIGNQWWMAENLNTTHYSEGTSIPVVESADEWNNLGSHEIAMCYYDNSAFYSNTYGALYTWAAAMNGGGSSNSNPSDIQGVCPSGWHLPSDLEWIELIDYLGGEEIAGGKMKDASADFWKSPNTGATNESGFMALPAGYRYVDGSFNNLGYDVSYWSTTEQTNIYIRYPCLHDYSSAVTRYLDAYKDHGFSVRCIKD